MADNPDEPDLPHVRRHRSRAREGSGLVGKRGPPKGEGGRPTIPIDHEVARRAASIGCTADEIAALLGVARATFYLNLERDPEFQRIIDEARASGRATLRRLQWQRANGGPTRC
jgi:hypothetical protein